jgi:hypothetical protein
MDSEVKIIISFIFKGSGKGELSFSDLYLTLSIKLNWFTPDDAKKFVNEAIEKKFLVKKDDLIRPSFDIEKVQVPLGFYPSKRVFVEEEPIEETPDEDLLTQIIRKISENINEKEQDILKKVKRIEEEKKVTAEVAALLIGKESNIDLSKFFDQIENQIFT